MRDGTAGLAVRQQDIWVANKQIRNAKSLLILIEDPS